MPRDFFNVCSAYIDAANIHLRTCALSLGISALIGCTSLSSQSDTSQPQLDPPEPPIYVTDRPFNSDTLYALLVAEMAGERQRFDIMLSNYVQQAEATDDPGVIERATRLARYLNAHETALNMARLWIEAEPDNTEAHFVAAAELVNLGQLVEAISHAEQLLKADEPAGLEIIADHAQQSSDKETATQLLPYYQRLITQYPNSTSPLLGASLLEQTLENYEQALTYSRLALKLNPDDFHSAAQEVRILLILERQAEANTKLARLIEAHPENPQLRLQYARTLLYSDLPAAQKQFEYLLERSPHDQDLVMTLALIELERGQLDTAKLRFQSLLKQTRHQSTAHYHLGRIAEKQQNWNEAITHLQQVAPSPEFVPAVALLAQLIEKTTNFEQAIQRISQKRNELSAEKPEHQSAIQELYFLEGYNLFQNDLLSDALSVLNQGLKQFPGSNRLLYLRGMTYAQTNNLEAAEVDFEKLLQTNPEDSSALNAWGYTLATKTNRLEEAYRYIREAYRLQPDDPAIIDSLGWVEFLRGNHEVALKNLRNAMKLLPDPEIAAHLGEVLWVIGQKKEARKVWNEGLTLNPSDPVILETLNRLKVFP